MAFGLCYPDEQWLNAVEKLIKATSISKHHAVGDAVHDCVTRPYPSAAGGEVVCNFRSLISLLILSFVIVMSYHVDHSTMEDDTATVHST